MDYGTVLLIFIALGLTHAAYSYLEMLAMDGHGPLAEKRIKLDDDLTPEVASRIEQDALRKQA